MEDDGVALSADALQALQQVLGTGEGGDSLDMLLMRRRAASSSSEEDDEDEQENSERHSEGIAPGESHADYYRRLYPERYADEAETKATIQSPRALVTMDDEYVQDLLLRAFSKRPNWKVDTKVPKASEKGAEGTTEAEAEPYHLHWGEYEHIDWFSPEFESGKFIASCYYNRKGMIRKGHLAHIMEKWHTKNPELPRFAPKSYVLSLDPREEGETEAKFDECFARAYQASGFCGFGESEVEDRNVTEDGNVWILKPSVTNQANGICLVRSEQQLRQAIARADDLQRAGDFVLQEYIPPLLLDGRKFHLRVFMLITGSIRAYIAPDFLSIFSLEKYDGAHLDDTRAHLTNIAHQQVLSEDDQHRCMRLFSETMQDMVDAGHVTDLEEAARRVDQVKDRVYDIMAKVTEAVSSELTFQTVPHGFELFGLDFMLDPEWNVWLLEANAEPDLSKAGDRLQGVIDKVLEDTLSIVVDQNPLFECEKEFAAASRDRVTLVKVFEREGRAF